VFLSCSGSIVVSPANVTAIRRVVPVFLESFTGDSKDERRFTAQTKQGLTGSSLKCRCLVAVDNHVSSLSLVMTTLLLKVMVMVDDAGHKKRQFARE
jgi:hypothetical protein